MKRAERVASLRGWPEIRFRWRTLRFEFGRQCYDIDSCGTVRATWWEWEE